MTFKRVEDEVREILEYNEAARADDMALYTYYVGQKTHGLSLGTNYLLKVFIDRRYRIIHGIAPYESVSRVRRKLQAEDVNLRPSKETIEERRSTERAYKQYAREKGERNN